MKRSRYKKAAWYANELISGKIFGNYREKSEIGPHCNKSIMLMVDKIRDINIKKVKAMWY